MLSLPQFRKQHNVTSIIKTVAETSDVTVGENMTLPLFVCVCVSGLVPVTAAGRELAKSHASKGFLTAVNTA